MVEQAVIFAEPAPPGGRPPSGDPRRVVLGLGLLERMVLALAHGGIRRILVLARGNGAGLDDLRRAAGAWRRTGAEVRLAGVAEAELPLANAPFLFAAGMAVFGPDLARHLRLLEAEGDRHLAPGGALPPPRFSGLALCRAASFQRLKTELGGAALPGSEGGFLASAPMLAVPGSGWVTVRSRADEGRARRLLRLSLGKPSDGFFSRHLNRRISWPISRLLMRLGVTPNPVTMANLLLGLLSGWLIGRGGYGNTLAAGLLFQFVSIFDGCDGEIARLTFRSSDFGTRLDNLCDTVVLLLFFLNLPIGLAAAAGPFYLLLGGLMALLVAVFYLLLLARIRLSEHHGNIAEIARQVQEKNKGGRPINWLEWLGVKLGFAYRKEFISLFAMACCVINRAEYILWFTVVLTAVGLVYQLDSIRKLLKNKQHKKMS